MTPALHLQHLTPGDEKLLTLSVGSELFCRRGLLRLTCPLLSQTTTLRPGQGWRAHEDLWVHLTPTGQELTAIEVIPAFKPEQRSRLAGPALQKALRWITGGSATRQ